MESVPDTMSEKFFGERSRLEKSAEETASAGRGGRGFFDAREIARNIDVFSGPGDGRVEEFPGGHGAFLAGEDDQDIVVFAALRAVDRDGPSRAVFGKFGKREFLQAVSGGKESLPLPVG